MKVGVYGQSTDPLLGGGYTIENEMLNALIKKFKNSNHEIVVITRGLFENTGVKPININSTFLFRLLRKPSKYVNWLFNPLKASIAHKICKNIILKENLDIIFYLSPGVNFDLEIPFITIIWDLQHRLQPFFPEVSGNFEFNSREKAYVKNLKRAAYIITGTEAGLQEIVLFYNIHPSRIRKIPHLTPSFEIEKSPTKPIDIVEKYKINLEYIFYPAQFWPHKNHYNLINALEILINEKKLNLDLILVGSDKGNRLFIENYAIRKGIKGNVKILGFVERNELMELYKNAKALVYVSMFGPENLPPLEAFSLGCPVIASKVSGAEEQLGDAAILVDPTNPKEIADAIERIIKEHETVNEMIRKGKIRAKERNSEAFAEKFYSVIEEFEVLRRSWR